MVLNLPLICKSLLGVVALLDTDEKSDLFPDLVGVVVFLYPEVLYAFCLKGEIDFLFWLFDIS